MTKEEVAMNLTRMWLNQTKNYVDEFEIARVYNRILRGIDDVKKEEK